VNAVDILVAGNDSERVARLVAKARAYQRDLIRTIQGDFVAMPEYSRWHRNVWMNRAREAKRDGLAEAARAAITKATGETP